MYWLQTIEPKPNVRQRLREAGHTGRFFTHPGGRARNIRGKSMENGGGLSALGLGLFFDSDQGNGGGGRPFIEYTLTALELRSVMMEAMRRRNKSFALVYTMIAGAPPGDHAGAEAWRASGCGVRVTLKEKAVGTEEAGTRTTHRPGPTRQAPGVLRMSS